MRGIFVRWFVLTAAIMVSAYVIEGIEVKGFFSALFAAAVLGILNAFFRPILIILTLPINILSMGLFTFVINAFLLMMVSGVISGFEVQGFWSAVFGSLLISIVNWFLSSFLAGRRRGSEKDYTKKDYIDLERRDGDKWE
jgi:putative membrane protein